jgi:predicted nucleotidyltransferase
MDRRPEQDGCIIYGYRGSVAHGMYRPDTHPNSIDDVDTMGVVIAPIEYYFGLQEWGSRGTKEIKYQQLDEVYYEFRKFVSLLCKGNPNVISLLWTKDLFITNVGLELIQNRDMFLSKHMYHAFKGYAHDQLYKMTHQQFQGYMGEKRKALVEKFGYDTKNASHCIRLLRMMCEVFTTGRFEVERQDAQELLDIKDGKWSLSKIKEESQKLFQIGHDLVEASEFPEDVDYGKINKLCVRILRRHFDNFV